MAAKKTNTKTPARKTGSALGNTLGNVGDWCSEHWFLTFLMVGGAMFTVRYVVDSITGSNNQNA